MAFQNRIRQAINGLVTVIVNFANDYSERYSVTDSCGYGALSLSCARQYLDHEFFSVVARDFGLERFHAANRLRDAKDPTTRLFVRLLTEAQTSASCIHDISFKPGPSLLGEFVIRRG